MKKATRYLLALAFLMLVGTGAFALYLLLPPLPVRTPDLNKGAPVALVADSKNNGKRCEAKAYCFGSSYCDRDFTIDPHCAALQKRLLDAAEANDVAAARSAVAMGANVNAPGLTVGRDWWIKSIHPAAFKGNTQVVSFLLDNGADVNDVYMCCFTSKTPLMEAIGGNHLETAQLLISRGANVHFKGIEDWTALRLAEQEGNENMIGLLDRAGAMSWRHRAERRLVKLYGKNPRDHRYKFSD